MAQEAKLNIEVDGKIKISDYSFPQREQSVIYFRLIKNGYTININDFKELTIVFIDNSNASNNITITSNQSNVVDIGGEKLVMMSLPNTITDVSSLYTAMPKINVGSGLKSIPPFSLAIYEKESAEMTYVRQVINQFNNALATYANLIKKDLLNAPNGVATTDSKNKILETYLPTKLKNHVEMTILTGSPHGIRLDSKGQLEYFDPSDSTYKLVQNQFNPNQPSVPPVVTVQDSVVTVKHDPTTLLSLQKWDYGKLNNVIYFQNSGKRFNGSTFVVDKAGDYTLYYKTTDGKEYLVWFTVADTQLSIIPPTITIVKGVALVKHHASTKVSLQKFTFGAQDANWFDLNGTVVYDNTFTVENVGTHTLFYQVEDGRKFIMPFQVTQLQLPPVNIMPTITLSNGVATVIHDQSTSLSVQKYTFGEYDKIWFQSNGITMLGKDFLVDKIGVYSYYYKTTNGDEFVLPVNVTMNDLPEITPPTITTFNGTVTVKFKSTMKVSMKKWDIGVKSIQHFLANGNTFSGDNFDVAVSGNYTLYYKLEDGREFTEVFAVQESELKQPHVIPNVTKGDSKFTVEFKAVDDVVLRKWDLGNKSIDYFKSSGKSTTSNSVTVPDIGEYTYYYKLSDGEEYVLLVNMLNQDMKQIPPTVSISKGVATVTHGKYMLLDIQKWDIGSKTIEYFQENGNVITDGRFLVNTVGSHSLYYRATWGVESVLEFNVQESQLASPHVPPVITVQSGIVNIAFDPQEVFLIKKWDSGNRDKAWFATNGTEFTGNTFKVTTTGTYTIYYKLDDERDYVQTFVVQSSMLPAPFIPPTILLNAGVATVNNHSSTVLGSQKWAQGNRDVVYFQVDGNILVDNKFSYTEVGDYTIYTKLIDGREFVTVVTVAETDLPIPRIDPTISIKDSVASIKYDNRIVATEQKWDTGNRDLDYFTSGGNVIIGLEFEVAEKGIHTFYYEREDGEKYIFTFEVDESMLRIPTPTITFDKRIATVHYEDGVNIVLEKFAEGIQDTTYFSTDGTIIQNHQFPIDKEGSYTLYYKVGDGREFTSSFLVTADDLNIHTPPTITIEGDTITVSYLPTVESQVTSKKWDSGTRTPEYFETAGNELTSNTFTAHSLGVNSYYYEYRGEGFVIEFFVWIPPTFIKKYGVVRVQNG